MKQYFGNYVGIVIQNNDPERSGKVKVFVPHITASVYPKWVSEKTDKVIKFLGSNLTSALTQALTDTTNPVDGQVNSILDELKLVLPWAQCAAPLIGESSSGRFNSYNNFGGISDSNFYSTFSQSTSSADNTPGKPGAFFEKVEGRLNDAFVNASQNVNRPNPLAYEYSPSTYSNRAKGSFSVPAVGSHVWVFFREGNPIMPVYFAAVFGETDWKGIYEAYDNPGQDYPETFENKNRGQTEYNVNVETYRNKYVMNQKGGSIEINNTDLKEKIKISHYSGSFKEFNNQANTELATGNNQKLVLNDEYETIRGFKNEYVGKSYDEIVVRDKFKKVGSLNAENFKKWKEIASLIQDNKQLFEIQRALPDNVLDANGNIIIKRNSLMQTRLGTFAPHPALDGTQIYRTIMDDATDITYALETNELYTIANSLINAPELLNFPRPPAIPQPVFIPGASFDIARYTEETNVIWGVGGPGASTSSQDGMWAIDPRKNNLQDLITANLQALTDIEKELGPGGSEIIQITKHKVETIGMEVNSFGSIRYDSIGKMLPNEVLVDNKGTYVNFKESPLVEYVHVQDMPGGNYTLNVCNRFNVLVGAGGLNLKSLGSTNITGTITNVVGEQLNLGSENEINIDASTINISAEILRLRNKRQRQVFIEDGLGVNKNVVIGGGLSVEGEMFIQHVTAPTEYQVTEITQLFGKLLAGMTFSADIVLPGVQGGSGTTSQGATVTLVADSIDNRLQCYDHSHVFKNLPLTLHDSNQAVRIEARELNKSDRVPATRRYHKKK